MVAKVHPIKTPTNHESARLIRYAPNLKRSTLTAQMLKYLKCQLKIQVHSNFIAIKPMWQAEIRSIKTPRIVPKS
jgi:hypothetical protein